MIILCQQDVKYPHDGFLNDGTVTDWLVGLLRLVVITKAATSLSGPASPSVLSWRACLHIANSI